MEPAVRIQNITKRYGSLTAVKNLSLEIFPGEVLGFLGPNGAGKTTTIQILCGLLAADEGKVLVYGAQTARSSAVKERIGLCPQDILIWPHLTCSEQLKWVGGLYGQTTSQTRRRAEELLELLGLTEKRDKQAGTLSGGMKRRLNLALALVHDPEILVLDEPEAGLDPQSRVNVRELIKSLAAEKTIILTTHNMDEADRLSDRVAVMDQGELLLVDTPERLKNRVGKGDVLELAFTNTDAAERAVGILAEQFTGTVVQEGRLLILRSLNILTHLATFLAALSAAGCSPNESRLRQNTLEDVFIQLTGRRLHE
ncbi:MAG: ABC transporter ATP-binding protein [Anaerolineales bacterium]|nr:ABC transporter ATP-binding protein [Anaerolineales bacterium]